MGNGYIIRGETNCKDLLKVLKIFNNDLEDPFFRNVVRTEDQTNMIFSTGSDSINIHIIKKGSKEFPLTNIGDKSETIKRFTYDEVIKIIDNSKDMDDAKILVTSIFKTKLEESKKYE